MQKHQNIVAVKPPFELKRLTVADIQTIIRRFNADADDELALAVLELTAALKRLAAEIRGEAEDRAVEWIDTHGELVVGPIRYYAGHRKVVSVINLREAVEASLAAVEGDLHAFCQLLASNALKHGACRGVLAPDQFDRLFATETKPELREGKVRKRLLQSNDFFAGPTISTTPTPTTSTTPSTALDALHEENDQ